MEPIKIVVVGGGIGGVSTAFDIMGVVKERQAALNGRPVSLTLLSSRPYFEFTPSCPWVAVRTRTKDEIRLDLGSVLNRKGINFRHASVERLEPSDNRLYVRDMGEGAPEDLQQIDYDYLVVATGPRLAFDQVKGLGPAFYTESICNGEHAEKAAEKWDAFCDKVAREKKGAIVVGAAPGASCFGPAYEHAMIMDNELRKKKLRKYVPITYVSSEPYVGHLGLGGVGDSKGLIESLFRERDIKWITNAHIDEVSPDTVHLTQLPERQASSDPPMKHDLPFDYGVFIPPFEGVGFLKNPKLAELGLTNAKGCVLCNAMQQNPAFKNVFVVGVATAIPPVETTPVATGAPKTGYMIETMGTATAHNIGSLMCGEEAKEIPSLNALCITDFGDEGAVFLALPQLPPRNVAWHSRGKWAQLAKIAFEKYFLFKVYTGDTDPYYEKWALKLLGIERLEHDNPPPVLPARR